MWDLSSQIGNPTYTELEVQVLINHWTVKVCSPSRRFEEEGSPRGALFTFKSGLAGSFIQPQHLWSPHLPLLGKGTASSPRQAPPSPRARLDPPLARVSSNRSPGPASYPSLFPASGLGEAALKTSARHGGPRRVPVRPELFVVLPGWLRGLGLQGVAGGGERRPRR